MTTDCPEMDSLFPQEQEFVKDAVPSRRREFAAGRQCARSALGNLGVPAQAILVGPDREPVWPRGIVGSISHAQGFYCAAVSRSLRSVGLDVEKVDASQVELIRDSAMGDEERVMADVLPYFTEAASSFLVFSAKETVYKCLRPRGRAGGRGRSQK